MSLRPVGVVFVLFGLFWGAWAVAAIDIERSLGLSVGEFGLLLSVSLIGAAANVVGGGLCERFGTTRIISLALGTWSAFLVFGAVSRPPGLLGLAIVLVVVSAGLIDVTINVASMTALADRPGRLVAFHARFNVGAAAGAAICGGLLALHISWRWIWVAVAAGAVVLAVICSRSPLPGAQRGEQVPWHRPLALLRHERLFVLAGIFALSTMVEGGIDLWGVLFLRSNLDAGLLLGAGGAVLGYSVAAVARTTLGPAIGRRDRHGEWQWVPASHPSERCSWPPRRCLPWGLPDSCWRQAASRCAGPCSWPPLARTAPMVPPLSVRSPLAGMWGWWQDRHSSGVWPALSDFAVLSASWPLQPPSSPSFPRSDRSY